MGCQKIFTCSEEKTGGAAEEPWGVCHAITSLCGGGGGQAQGGGPVRGGLHGAPEWIGELLHQRYMTLNFASKLRLESFLLV